MLGARKVFLAWLCPLALVLIFVVGASAVQSPRDLAGSNLLLRKQATSATTPASGYQSLWMGLDGRIKSDSQLGVTTLPVARYVSAACVSTANLDLSGAETLDGIATGDAKTVLVTGQTAAAQNGIYTSNSSGGWSRHPDADQSYEFIGLQVLVTGGNSYANSTWYAKPSSTFSVGTDDPAFQLVDASTQLVAGGSSGLTLSGRSLSLNVNGDYTAMISNVVVPTGHSYYATRSPLQTGLATSGAVNLNMGLGNVFVLAPTGDMTVSLSNTQAGRGIFMSVIVDVSDTTSRTITFDGATIVSTGTLATGTDPSKTFTVMFAGDGTKLYEVARTAAMP